MRLLPPGILRRDIALRRKLDTVVATALAQGRQAMASKRLAALALVAALVAGCAGQRQSWRSKYLTKRTPYEMAQVCGDVDAVFTLGVDEIASLPDQTVFLAGSYRRDAGDVFSVLLVSRDGGKTWEDTGLNFGACKVLNVQTAPPSHIWGIVTFTTEGALEPVGLVKSSDAGATWEVIPFDFIDIPQSLTWVRRLEFCDALHGSLILFGMQALGAVYATSDSGNHWRRMWHFKRTPAIEDTQWDSPPDRTAKVASLWQMEHDFAKIARTVRFRYCHDSIVVWTQDFSEPPNWVQQSRIPVKWCPHEGALVPTLPPASWREHRNSDGDSRLHTAVRAGDMEGARSILAAGDGIEELNREGLTPLHIAVRAGNVEMVRLLLSHLADVDAPCPVTDDDLPLGGPLHRATADGNLEIARLLIAHGANPNALTYNGDCLMVDTPLECAADGDSIEVTRLLLDSGADIEGAGVVFYWPLDIAARAGFTDLMRLLIDRGASIERTGVDGYTDLHMAAFEGQKSSAEVLLSCGANVNARGYCDQTPLHVAAMEGHADIAEVLLSYGAAVNAKDSEGQTPVAVAEEEGFPNVAEILRRHGGTR